jgi:pimeloyl-ACP methyl ester carboxylesterase
MIGQEIKLHGQRFTFQRAGSGPVIVLLHGIAGSSETFGEVLPWLAEDYTVLAPDLLGHGRSAKPRGDYSIGAYANLVRDLLSALNIDRVSLVGHSLGGGVAAQFAYQFPEQCERLVLVSSGGLGREVSLLLRAASLPAVNPILSVLCASRLRQTASGLAGLLTRIGLRLSPDLDGFLQGYTSLADGDARRAFVYTLGTMVDFSGQRVSAVDRLYLAAEIPTLIVWGDRDPIIPIAHAHAALARIPHAQLEIFSGAGHFPHREDPHRFVRTLVQFMRSTAPARINAADWRKQLNM